MPRIAVDISPQFRGSSISEGNVTLDTTTFNQVGITFNQSGIPFGGFYGSSDSPQFIAIASIRPQLTAIANRTQSYLSDNGITFNQAGVTFNDARYSFGGVYGYLDVKPLTSLATSPKPRITNYADIYTHPIPPGQNSGMLIGILGLTYP